MSPRWRSSWLRTRPAIAPAQRTSSTAAGCSPGRRYEVMGGGPLHRRTSTTYHLSPSGSDSFHWGGLAAGEEVDPQVDLPERRSEVAKGVECRAAEDLRLLGLNDGIDCRRQLCPL